MKKSFFPPSFFCVISFLIIRYRELLAFVSKKLLIILLIKKAKSILLRLCRNLIRKRMMIIIMIMMRWDWKGFIWSTECFKLLILYVYRFPHIFLLKKVTTKDLKLNFTVLKLYYFYCNIFIIIIFHITFFAHHQFCLFFNSSSTFLDAFDLKETSFFLFTAHTS